MPLVSIIIATYRGGEFLRQTIVSVLRQDFANFELLVSDDGNDLETREIAASFQDCRIFYSANAQNLGPAGNHWTAMRRARGEFMAILNHDDLWKPTFLSQMLVGFQTSGTIVAFSDHDVIDPAGNVLASDTKQLSRQTGREELARGLHLPFLDLAMKCSVPAAQSALFRADALDLGALPEEAGPAYDFWLNYLLAKTGGGAFYIPERLASWRKHDAAISKESTRSDWPAGAGACWERMAIDPLFREFQKISKRQAADCYGSAALACLRGERIQEARAHISRAMKNGWTIPRVAAIFLLAFMPTFLRQRFLPSSK